VSGAGTSGAGVSGAGAAQATAPAQGVKAASIGLPASGQGTAAVFGPLGHLPVSGGGLPPIAFVSGLLVLLGSVARRALNRRTSQKLD
jgi:hypothetical protein